MPLKTKWSGVALFTAAMLATAAAGCRQPASESKPLNYARELPPGELALRKIAPDRYPDFSRMQTDRNALVKAIDQSLIYLDHPSSKRYFPYLDITHERAVNTLRALADMAEDVTTDWNAAIRKGFDVYQSIGAPADAEHAAVLGPYTGEVLFTGYFTPIYDASLMRTDVYSWPLYKRPPDLLTDDSGEAIYRRADGTRPSGRSPEAGGVAPVAASRYWTRAQIEREGKLAGQELVWLKSRWEAYVVTVQGSARLRLTDGRTFEIGFAGTNGYGYASPGVQMLRDGVIGRDQLSLKGLGEYFRKHPEQLDRYLSLNPRTTFFTERPGGPFGKLNVPVTALATLATDKEVYPRALPAFIATRLSGSAGESRHAFSGLLLDQDAGGAIRSAGRADIYTGIGPQAEQSAGDQLSPGTLYYLAIKNAGPTKTLGASKIAP